MKIIVIGNTLGDLDVINRHLEHSGADIVLCTGDVGILPQKHQSVPRFFTNNNFYEYLYGEKWFNKPVYAVRGAHDNIALYLDIIHNEGWIKNFLLIPDGGTVTIPQNTTDSIGLKAIRIAGIGGSYSDVVFNKEKSELEYKDKRNFNKHDVSKLEEERIDILLMHDIIGGCNSKNIDFSEDMCRFVYAKNPLYCFVGKTGWWGYSKLGDTRFVSLPNADKGYLLIDTGKEWNATGIRFDFEGDENGIKRQCS